MEENAMNTSTQLGGNKTQTQQAETEKMFTQEEVNRIVQERLARGKTPNEPNQSELDLQARENALYVREQVAEFGLPKELVDEFKGMDKVTVDKCIKIIAPYVQKLKEPILNAVGPTNNGASGTEAAQIRAAMGLKR